MAAVKRSRSAVGGLFGDLEVARGIREVFQGCPLSGVELAPTILCVPSILVLQHMILSQY